MHSTSCLLAAAFAVAALSPAFASDEADSTGWSGQITPYVWAAGIGGSLRPFTGAPTISFDKSFSEVLEDSDGAFFLTAFARKDRFVVLADFSYSASSKDGLVPPGIPATGELKQMSFTLTAGYRDIAQEDVTLDLLVGSRIWDVKTSITVGGGFIQESPGDTFADPIIAARANFMLGPRWSAILYADVGGLGVGSEHTGQILGTFNYRATDQLYISAGYRWLTVDYRNDGTRVDADMAGPLLGATWRF